MVFSASCLCDSALSLKVTKPRCDVRASQSFSLSTRSHKTNLSGQAVNSLTADVLKNWSFITGSRIVIKPNFARVNLSKKGFINAQIASNAFTLGTIAVLPFYALMVAAPKAELTKKSMQSNIPYVVLGLLYAYLLYLSWTPETVQFIFASKYWLPELPGISKMFASEMTLASAWIHLLAVDLFAARQVYHDGLENRIETRHSVSLCLFFCPIGILIHVITKALTKKSGAT